MSFWNYKPWQNECGCAQKKFFVLAKATIRWQKRFWISDRKKLHNTENDGLQHLLITVERNCHPKFLLLWEVLIQRQRALFENTKCFYPIKQFGFNDPAQKRRQFKVLNKIHGVTNNLKNKLKETEIACKMWNTYSNNQHNLNNGKFLVHISQLYKPLHIVT